MPLRKNLYHLLVFLASVIFQPSYAKSTEWQHYGGDIGGSRYSSLTQINKANVAQLKPVWTYHTGDINQGDRKSVV